MRDNLAAIRQKPGFGFTDIVNGVLIRPRCWVLDRSNVGAIHGIGGPPFISPAARRKRRVGDARKRTVCWIWLDRSCRLLCLPS